MGRIVNSYGVRAGSAWWRGGMAVLLALFGGAAWGANLAVTVGGEDNTAGTLRAALATANSNGEPDTITFSLGTASINITTMLALTEDGTTVDGGGQITIVDGGAPTGDPIWRVTSGQNTLKNLTLLQSLSLIHI